MLMLLVALLLLSCIFVAIIARDVWGAGRVPLLGPLQHPSASLPTLTVIIPARNEALRITRCLTGLAAQNLADLDIVVLDDNSTDDTAEIVRSFAAQLPGLRLLTGEPLPPGWAGKCWACWQAAQASEAEWLLFLDADTAPQPHMVATLVDYAVNNRIDLLTLLPLLELHSFWERVLMPPFVGIIQAVMPIDVVNDPRSSLALANGQCILIRRDVYFATGGHAAVRDSVLEDVRLAQTVKQAGYRLRAVGGPELMGVRMYTNLAEITEGLRKNAFAGARAGGGWRTAWGGFRQALLALGPLALITIGLALTAVGHGSGALVLGFGVLLFVLTVTYWGYLVARLHQLNPLWALFYPLGTLGYFSLAGLAFLSILRGRGVTWKDRTYQG
ncbi:MAG: glycosyltransferase family 2 protein [Chloroflexota bacterium]|nr:glycosyltransferase family 2 protein [Chloroflexota bacterium]PLS79178.1 MAG: glycosyl transferase [Chloroflexota bacterium]